MSAFFIYAAIGFIALVSALCVAGLRHATIQGTSMSLVVALRRLNAAAVRPHLNLAPQNPWMGAACLTLALCVLVGIDFLPESIANHNTVAWIGALGMMLLVFSRAYFQPRADVLLREDAREPVLLLRSFVDDEKTALQASNQYVFDATLESRLSAHFSGFGPFIAVATPGEPLPVIGAARIHLSDSDWQAQVVSWIDSASLVLVLAGTTPWIDWELQTVRQRGAMTKLIVAFPPYRATRLWKDKATRRFRENMTARLDQLRRSLQGSAWSLALSELQDATTLKAIVFNTDGTVTAIRARSRNRNAYHLAIMVAHALKVADGKLEGGAQRAPEKVSLSIKEQLAWWGVAALALLGWFVSEGENWLYPPIYLAAALFILVAMTDRFGYQRRVLRIIRGFTLAIAVLSLVHAYVFAIMLMGVNGPLGLGPYSASVAAYPARFGSSDAKAVIGVSMVTGLGSSPNPTKGCALLRDYARIGDERFLGVVAACVNHRFLDAASVAAWLEAAVDSNNALVHAMLGRMYFVGSGVRIDFARAEVHLRKLTDTSLAQKATAAQRTALVEAQRDLGLLLVQTARAGEGIKYLLRSAASGDLDAMAMVGAAALAGDAMPQDLVLARRYNEAAAAAGHPLAQLNFGVMLATGTGVLEDRAAARDLFTAAAARSQYPDVALRARDMLSRIDELQ